MSSSNCYSISTKLSLWRILQRNQLLGSPAEQQLLVAIKNYLLLQSNSSKNSIVRAVRAYSVEFSIPCGPEKKISYSDCAYRKLKAIRKKKATTQRPFSASLYVLGVTCNKNYLTWNEIKVTYLLFKCTKHGITCMNHSSIACMPTAC